MDEAFTQLWDGFSDQEKASFTYGLWLMTCGASPEAAAKKGRAFGGKPADEERDALRQKMGLPSTKSAIVHRGRSVSFSPMDPAEARKAVKRSGQ